MPKRSSELLLLDMIEAANKVNTYTRGMNFSTFSKDSKTIDAVCRNFEVLGEAANRLSKVFQKANSEIDWVGIVGLRNRIIHEYFGVDKEVLWEIVLRFIPPLRKSLKNLKKREMA